ncbi:response regulator transcription factor [Anaerolineales bacterium HSG24]|nr:response regulator transcription factor [Anaerolineales bacterium HSG24]
MPKILVVDDDKKIVRLVRAYLEKTNFEVLTAFDGETALHIIRRDQPDLVVLDLMLPDRDGWDITRIIRTEPNLAHLPIIMLTARVEDSDKIVGLELGADDYISKPFNPKEVVARVRAVLRRSETTRAVDKQVAIQIGALRIELTRHQLLYHNQPLELTPTEFELIKLLMENPGRVFSRTELIEKGLGYSYEGLERTVDSHIKNIRKKVNAPSDSPAYIETVRGVGYRLRGER